MQSDTIGTGERKGTICEQILRPWPNFEFYHEPNFCLNFNKALSKKDGCAQGVQFVFLFVFQLFPYLVAPSNLSMRWILYLPQSLFESLFKLIDADFD